jgi:hypothetical protein
MTSPVRDHQTNRPDTRAREQLVVDAVTVLTAAARRSGDFAEFMTHALAGAAANLGGIEQLLAGRPESWEAHYVRDMLIGTVGRDEHILDAHRTEPVVIRVHVDDVLHELGYADLYYLDTDQELTRRDNAIYAAAPAELTPEQQATLDRLEDLRDQLDAQRLAEWTAYGVAFAENVRRVAAETLPGLAVPVEVVLEQEWRNDLGSGSDCYSLEFRLWNRARDLTPLPGSGIPPTDYPPGVDIAQAERDAGRTPLARLDAKAHDRS